MDELDLPPDWDDSEDDDKHPGPNPERLNIEGLSLDEIARLVMEAGKPTPGEDQDNAAT